MGGDLVGCGREHRGQFKAVSQNLPGEGVKP